MQIGNAYDDAIQISRGALATTETFFSSCDFCQNIHNSSFKRRKPGQKATLYVANTSLLPWIAPLLYLINGGGAFSVFRS